MRVDPIDVTGGRFDFDFIAIRKDHAPPYITSTSFVPGLPSGWTRVLDFRVRVDSDDPPPAAEPDVQSPLTNPDFFASGLDAIEWRVGGRASQFVDAESHWINGESTVYFHLTPSAGLYKGSETLQIRPIDLVGFPGGWSSYAVHWDPDPPAAPSNFSVSPVAWNQFVVNWAAVTTDAAATQGISSNVSGIAYYEYWVDGGPHSTTTGTGATTPPVSAGDHYFHVFAVDGAGNVGPTSSVHFRTPQYTLSTAATGCGSVTRQPDLGVYEHGAGVTLTASPCVGWSFTGWSGAVGGSNPQTSVVMDGNKSVTAHFAINQYGLSLSTSGCGSISRSPDRPTYEHGSQVSLTAAPCPCWHFVNWTGDVAGTANPIGTVMDRNRSAQAVFARDQHVIAADAGPGGSIHPSGAVSIACGDGTTFTITPQPCYAIADVLVDGSSVGPVSSYTFSNVQGNRSISAAFSLLSYTISASAGPGGSISPAGALTVSCGADAAYLVTPEPCHAVGDVRVDGQSVGAVTRHTISNVRGDRTIAASFVERGFPCLASTVGWWRFEEGSGSAIVDSSGHGNDGTLIAGAFTPSVPFPTVPFSGADNRHALSLAGAGGVVIPDAPLLRPAAEISVEAWIKTSAAPAGTVVDKRFGSTSSFRLEHRDEGGSTLRFVLADPSGDSAVVAGPGPVSDVWHQVAGSWDGDSIRLYLDGRLLASAPFAGPIGYDDQPVLIGAGDDAGTRGPSCCHWSGAIDEVRVSSQALDPPDLKVARGLLAGTVREGGSPLAGAEITAYAGGDSVGSAATDGGGAYRLWLPPGTYDAVARAPSEGQGVGAVIGRAAIHVEPSDTVTVDFQLASAGLSGTVRRLGAPLPGAIVVLEFDGTYGGTRTTDGAGRYSFGRIPGGHPHVLGVRSPSGAAIGRRAVTVAAGGAGVQDFDFQPARLVGQILEDGAPLEGARVEARLLGQVDITVTGADGRYAFDDIQAGDFRGVTVRAPDASIVCKNVIFLVPQTTNVLNCPPQPAVHSVSPQRWDDRSAFTLTVTGVDLNASTSVVLRRDGEADLRGRFVQVFGSNSRLTALVDATGAKPGPWDLVLSGVRVPAAVTLIATSASFLRSTTDTAGTVGQDPALRFTSSGSPVVAYLETGSDLEPQRRAVKYAVRTPLGWTAEDVDRSGRSYHFTSLALDALDRPHLAYASLSAPRGLLYATRVAGSWRIETVTSASVDGGTSIVLDPGSQQPRIAFRDESDLSLKVATRAEGGWTIETVDTGDVGGSASLAAAANGDLHVTYFDHALGGVRYARRAGGWSTEVVAAGASPSSHSLALDRSGHPRLAFRTWASGDQAPPDLHYAEREGAGWRVEVVDTAGRVGYAASLALDAQDRPHIAYFSPLGGTTTALNYARRDGGSWTVEAIDTEGRPGGSSSLAISALGTLAAAYPADQTGDLRYAERFAISGLSPGSGGDTGSVTVTVRGSGLRPGATVTLRRSGETDIAGAAPLVAADGASVTAVFDLRQRARGAWDLRVVDPGGTRADLASAFQVEAAAGAAPWVDLIGPAAIRRERVKSYVIACGNTGNVDALHVPLWITGVPRDAIVSLDFPVRSPARLDGEPDWSAVPVRVTGGATDYIPLIVGRIPPGVSHRRLFVTIPAGAGDPAFVLGATLTDPWLGSSRLGSCLGSAMGSASCLATETAATSAALAALSGTEVLGAWAYWTRAAWRCGAPAAEAQQRARAALDLMHQAATAEVTPACRKVLRNASQAFLPVALLISADPNAKLGPAGSGSARHVAASRPLPYTILFENVGTAPAQEVIVDDHLDLAHLDPSTVSFGPIAFGSTLLTPAPGQHHVRSEVDQRPARELLVRVAADFDPTTGRARWTFRSIDPRTGEMPDDTAGFLPPNRVPPEGEGGLGLVVSPRGGAASGTVVLNEASIGFDENAPLRTPPWSNTLDAEPPRTAVRPLPAMVETEAFEVRWAGEDDASGLRDVEVWVSEDGGPWDLWLDAATDTADVFTGIRGHRYAFYSVGRDSVGHREAAPLEPDATVRIVGPTATLLSIRLEASAGSVVVLGRVPAPHAAVSVQRRGATGPWELLGVVTADRDGAVRFEDRSRPDGRCAYRLGIDGLEPLWSAEAWVESGLPLSLAFVGAHPDPARSGIDLLVTLPDARIASLEAFDVRGRRVDARRLEGLAGRHRVRLEGLPAGLYLVRLEHGGAVLHRKAVLLR